MDDSIIIRKSPIVIVKDFVMLQFFAILAYFLLAIVGNYEYIYKAYIMPVVSALTYEIAKFIFISLGEIILMGYIFLRWFFETYTIDENTIIHHSGVIFKNKETIVLNKQILIKSDDDKFSQLLNYGSIIINNKISGETLILPHIQNPESYVKLIFEQRNKNIVENIVERAEDIYKLLEQGEHEKLELKSSFRWDVRANKLNRAIEHMVMKTIAAFLNTKGGHLIIGIDNNKNIIGLEYDYQSLPKQNSDTFENHFTNVFKEVIGTEHRLFVKLIFYSIDNKDICVVQVLPSDKPAYVKSDQHENFYIRTGNSTTALKLSEVIPYAQSRWQKI